MPALESLDAKFERDGVVFQANLVKLENAVLIFFYEGASKLGTVALSHARNLGRESRAIISSTGR